MASKSFTIGEEKEESSMCSKLVKFAGIIVIIAVSTVVGIYAFKKTVMDYSGCNIAPILDENGYYNWTIDAEAVAFGCFPGFFMEAGSSDILLSTCINNSWVPGVPACNFLPLRLDCEVNNSGLVGSISMWQKTTREPTYISGLIDYTDAVKTEGHLLEAVVLSKGTCEVSDDFSDIVIPEKNSTEIFKIHHLLNISFVSDKLKAFKKAEVHLNMIFLDVNTTQSIISVRQDKTILVMPVSIPSSKLQNTI